MSAPIVDTISGSVKLNGLPERATFRSWEQFITALPGYLTIELPRGATGVIVGNATPSEDDRDKIWVRRNSSGDFLGLYTFTGNAWHPYFQFATGELLQPVWVIGDSNNVPEGFVLIDVGDAIIPSGVVNALRAQYVPNPAGPGFAYFAVRYIGF